MIAIPQLKNKFFCIVDRHSPELTAMVSSYLIEENYYLPIFEIQAVTAPRTHPIANPPDEHTFSQERAEEVATSIRNAIVKLNGAENIIVVGLSEDQKTYLQLPDGFNIITIDCPEDINIFLSPFFEEQRPILSCQPDEILKGLQQAVLTKHWLKIDLQAAPLTFTNNANGSCVVIEDDQSAMAVAAVNYALSVQAEVIVVSPLIDGEERDILYYFSDWKLHGDLSAYDRILNAINTRIGAFSFSGYDYVTFFTAGIPYSLTVGAITCCTYVHMHCWPDHFTFNNILYATQSGTGAGLVFSPLDFNSPVLPSANREIENVSKELSQINIHIHQLVGKQATMYNLSHHLQHYPYDLLHICSHGGKYRVREFARNS
ncbi:hypothetical protein [Chitinophaga pinensis]|uniref:CHAT domain-containing protein n=1 Tax=Chitinophaga pinensis TaxID=79329 RepID=A0A5C6LZX6_9BACT|nr:hypothetical protein [Chitinophaga pinensis]TWW02218.1 hypothetical protein FEF09_03485 [Chitinophaga pinensis]